MPAIGAVVTFWSHVWVALEAVWYIVETLFFDVSFFEVRSQESTSRGSPWLAYVIYFQYFNCLSIQEPFLSSGHALEA
jgi:hypothetical protein